jgi:hypothetical protein
MPVQVRASLRATPVAERPRNVLILQRGAPRHAWRARCTVGGLRVDHEIRAGGLVKNQFLRYRSILAPLGVALAFAASPARAEQVSSGICNLPASDAAGSLFADLASVAPDCSNIPAPALPAWLPATFNFGNASAGVATVLAAQGHPAASMTGVHHVVFSDIDQTLLKTVQPVLFRNAAGQLLHDTDGNLIMIPDKDFVGALNALKAKFPALDWASYHPDFSEFNSIDGILHTPEIPTTVNALKNAKKDASTRVVLITARSGDNTADAMAEYFHRRNLAVDGVMAVNNPGQNAATGMTDPTLKSAWKKSLAMAANLKLMDPDGTQVKDVTYFEDGDDNMVAAMQLLPAMFPSVKFRFVDLIHTGHRHFAQKEISTSGTCGQLLSSGDGHALSPDDISGYKSVDIEWPPKPADGDLPAPPQS